jgi:hypothetical protein
VVQVPGAGSELLGSIEIVIQNCAATLVARLPTSDGEGSQV